MEYIITVFAKYVTNRNSIIHREFTCLIINIFRKIRYKFPLDSMGRNMV